MARDRLQYRERTPDGLNAAALTIFGVIVDVRYSTRDHVGDLARGPSRPRRRIGRL